MAYDYIEGLNKAVDTYIQGKRIADYRKMQLEDLASQRAYDASQAEKASERRIAEGQALENLRTANDREMLKERSKAEIAAAEEKERLRLATELATLGVDTTDENGKPLPMKQLVGNLRTFQRTKAENMLTHFNEQLQLKNDEIRSVMADMQKSALKVNPEINRRALELTLADPTVLGVLDAKMKEDLNEALASGKDVSGSVKKVFERLSDALWRSDKKSSTFYQTYLSNVNTLLGPQQQLDMAVGMKRLEALEYESRNLASQRDKHVIDFSPFLPPSTLKQQAPVKKEPAPPPVDPNEAFTAKPEPVAPVSNPVNPEGFSSTFEKGGALGVVKRLEPERAPIVGPILRGVNAFVPGMQANQELASRLASVPTVAKRFLVGSDVSNPIPKADVLTNRGIVDARVNQSQKLLDATPEEWAAAEKLGMDYGLTPARLAAAKVALQRGDPATIATANRLIQMVRSANQFTSQGQ